MPRLLASLLLSLVLTSPVVGVARADTPLAEIPTPKGWRKETIELPPAFARDMKWRGVEELRFAPGMFKPEEPDFFTYYMFFSLEGVEPIDEKQMASELAKYYQGLSEAVLSSRKPDAKASKVVVKRLTAKSKSDKPKSDKPREPWRETQLQWTEPFATQKTQTLTLKWKSQVVGDRTAVMILASPSKSKEVWASLAKLAAGVKLKKP